MVYPPLLVLFQLQFKVIITCNSFNKTEKHCYATETSWQLCELLKDLLDLTSWSEEAIYCSVHMWRTMSKTMSHAERSVYLSSCDFFFFFLKNSIMRFWRKSKAKNGFFCLNLTMWNLNIPLSMLQCFLMLAYITVTVQCAAELFLSGA